jgi:hypothetical protein
VFGFRCQFTRGLGNSRQFASVRIVNPAFRQIKPDVDRCVAPAVGQHAEHRDLTIIHFTQPAGPLPGDAHRTISLFGETAFINDQATGGLATQQAVGVGRHPGHHRCMIPRQIADEMLKLLRAAMFNHGGHRFERAIVRLGEAAQIAMRDGRVVATTGSKQPTVALERRVERAGNLVHQRCRQASSAHAVT